MRTSLLAPATLVVALLAGAGTGVQHDTVVPADALTRAAATRLLKNVGGLSARAASTWCGTAVQADQSPNVVAGHPAHWIYAIPSDGQDRLGSVASSMQTDAETISGWWRGQDPTREPRFDLAPLSCGAQLDVSSIRLSHSSSQLSPPDMRFSTIVADVSAAGFESRFDKYVIYYDGPAPSEICGQGGGFVGGVGYAIVYVQACAGIQSSVVAIHELTHTFGAVPTGAPHMCPAPNAFHVCDASHDLMYPFADGTPLSGLTLDVGRDDYYGHSGGWQDIQDSPWLVQNDRQVPFALSVSGPGTVVSDVPGLQCTQACSTTWNADTNLVLTATPAPGAKLVRWGGACSGSFVCSFRAGAGTSATALFAPARFRLSIAVAGRGSVRSATGVSCARRCSAAVSSYTPLRLTARPAKGWRLKAWSGSCRGKRLSCTLPMNADMSVRATFARR